MFIYGIKDKVTEKLTSVTLAENEKDCIRILFATGFFKIYRIDDMEVLEIMSIDEKYSSNKEPLNIRKVLEELSINMENKGEIVDTKKMENKLFNNGGK